MLSRRARAEVSDETERTEQDRQRARHALRHERRRMQRLRLTEAGVALAALFVSISVFMINGAFYWRGSEIVTLPPKGVLFYRSSGPRGATLWVALQAQMINASREYGDVVTEATASFEPDEARGEFANEVFVTHAMSSDVDRAMKDCPQGVRCIPATGFYVMERPATLLDVPGGQSRSEMLSFRVESAGCEGGDVAYCNSFPDYEAGVRYLRGKSDVAVLLKLKFQFDGVKVVRCKLMADDFMKTAYDYLDEKGWTLVECAGPAKPA